MSACVGGWVSEGVSERASEDMENLQQSLNAVVLQLLQNQVAACRRMSFVSSSNS